MTPNRLEYPLVDGFLHHWLFLGPSEEAEACSRDGLLALLEPAEAGRQRLGAAEFRWRYSRAPDDHGVVVADSGSTAGGAALAYTCLRSEAARPVALAVTTTAPMEVWLRDEFLGHIADAPDPSTEKLGADLEVGDNPLVFRVKTPGAGGAEATFAVRLVVPAGEGLDGVSLSLPTVAKRPVRRATLEHVAEHAYLPHRVVHRGDSISLRWSQDLDTRWRLAYLVQDERGRSYLNGTAEAKAWTGLNVGHPARLWERRYFVVVRALPMEYYEDDLRYERRLPVHVLDTPYSDAPYGTPAARRREALENAARREGDPFGQIARMALGRWRDVQADVLRESVDAAKRHEGDPEVLLLGLLGAVYRYGGADGLPSEVGQALEECLIAYPLGIDGAHGDALSEACSGDPIASWACELLAGQRYPDRTFGYSGQLGARIRQSGEQRVLTWLRQRGAWGWTACDGDSLVRHLYVLSHLTDLAEDINVRELSAVLMDKILFTLAANSYGGVYGFAKECGKLSTLGSGQLEPTAPVARLLWGLGVWNHRTAATVALACSGYEVPPPIAGIAADRPEALWHRERHVEPGSGQEVCRATFRTPDYALSSIGSRRPGETGGTMRLWQATLGPDALVFVSHPATWRDKVSGSVAFRRGNGVHGRVAQWQDTLVAVYHLSEDDLAAFTRAHFPVGEMDEHALLDGWAFARRGKGLLALTASGGVELVRQGPGAYRELRPRGCGGVWLCHMGRATAGQDFVSFQRRIRRLSIEWVERGVRCTTLQGATLSFSWDEPMRVDGKEVPLPNGAHCDSPYCVAQLPATEMAIRYADTIMVLDFG